jgi:hypothetical protein
MLVFLVPVCSMAVLAVLMKIGIDELVMSEFVIYGLSFPLSGWAAFLVVRNVHRLQEKPKYTKKFAMYRPKSATPSPTKHQP